MWSLRILEKGCWCHLTSQGSPGDQPGFWPGCVMGAHCGPATPWPRFHVLGKRLGSCVGLCAPLRGLERAREESGQKREGVGPAVEGLGRRAGGVGVPVGRWGGRFWKGWDRSGGGGAGLCGSGCEYSPAAAAYSLWARIPSPQAGSDLPAGAGGAVGPGQPTRRETSSLGVYTGERYTESRRFSGSLQPAPLLQPQRGLVLLVCAVGGLIRDCTVLGAYPCL